MRAVEIKRKDGKTDIINTYTVTDFPYEKLNTKSLICKHKKEPKYLIYTFATFDIETTSINTDRPYAFMYHWQMDVGGYVITGRRWEEWIKFINRLTDIFDTGQDKHFVIYIHNAGFEYQFMVDFLRANFGEVSIFAAQKRKPIYITCENGLEFRCSWKLTNMSLYKATNNELGVIHAKAKGDLDYRKIRTADTPLDDTEFAYCVSDVVSLYELIECRLYNEHDNLESIPMTSTGYVRRDCRNSCRKDPYYRDDFLRQRMNADIYTLLLDASRGGDTHANRYMSGRVWHDVDSYDVVSSYPAQMIMRKYPMTKFTPYGSVETISEFDKILSEHACLFRVIFTGLKIKDNKAMPYIAIDKATAKSKSLSLDNGRVLTTIAGEERGYIALALTDIDYRLIERQYTWDSISISEMYIADYAYLPNALLEPVMQYFKAKCSLKDKIKALKKEIDAEPDNKQKKEELENLEYLYAKSKNRLNGIFGMTYTKPVRSEITVDDAGEWLEKEVEDIQAALDKYYNSRNSFLVYAWGVWVTAWARMHLADLVDATGQENTIYCDTDSSKAVSVDKERIEVLNAKIITIAEERGAYCDYNGTRYYMGIYEHENKEPIRAFKTLGAKKYVYEDSDGMHVTISGVDKAKGAGELGTIDNFKPGFVFKDAGGVDLYYNDGIGIHEITVDGCTMTTASNVAVLDSTYTIGITAEYAEIIGYNIYYDIDKF